MASIINVPPVEMIIYQKGSSNPVASITTTRVDCKKSWIKTNLHVVRDLHDLIVAVSDLILLHFNCILISPVIKGPHSLLRTAINFVFSVMFYRRVYGRPKKA